MKRLKMLSGGLAIAILATSALFTSCDKKDDPTSSPESMAKRHTQSRATKYGNDWVYFSFESGKEVAGINEENRAQRLDWDIAFNRYNIRTNSGTSGKGKGGVIDTGKKQFKEVKNAPESGYVVDEKAMIMFGFGKMMQGGKPEMGESTLNKVLKGAIEIDTSNPPPKYIVSEHVYIVKTANGKYVKMQVESFHNNKGESGYVTFRYVYQPDGTPKFK